MRKINFKRAVLASMLSLSAFCVLGVSAAYAWVNTNDGIRDGDLVRFDIRNSDGTPALESLDVYIIKLVDEKRAYKRVILNPWIFNSYSHFHWNDIKTLPALSIGDYITSSLVRIDGHDEIHVLSPQPNSDSGQKSWVNLNENEFLYAGGDPASVYTINQSDFSCYTEAGSIRSVDDFRAFNALGVSPKKIGISSLMIFPVTNAEGVDVIKKGVSSPFLNFNLYAEGEDVRIKSIVFTVWATGTAVCTNVKDILVYGPDGSLVSTTPVSVGSDCRAKVKFNAYRITDKDTATFTVKARVDSPQEYLKLGIDTTLDIDTDAIMMSMLDAERNLGFDSEGRLGWETTPVVGNLKKVIP